MIPDSGPSLQAGAFLTTQWTRVGMAKLESEEGRRALADLCSAYYEPVVAFLRWELRDADAAREMGHEFFEKMLEGDAIAGAERGRGRFRSYLLGAVKHFVINHRAASRRQKRGGGLEQVSINDDESGTGEIADRAQASPDAAFDRQWALVTLARAMEAIKEECAKEGRAEFFQRVKPWLTGEAAHGDQGAVAEACGMSVAALKMAISRLRRRYREALRDEIAATLEDEAMIEGEMRELFAALAT